MPISIHFTRFVYSILGAGFCLWVCLEATLSLRRRASADEASGRDKNTLSAIWATLVLGYSIAAIIACVGVWPMSNDPRFVCIGVALFAAGVVLRLSSIVTLGRLFTYNVAIREGHTLKTTGLYRVLRHPGYAGLLLAFVGVGLALNDWLSFAVGVVPLVLVLAKRIDVEEKVLVSEFGDAYVQYQRNTYRLLPGIY